MLPLVLLAATLVPVRAVDREVWSIYDTVESAAAAEDHQEELPPEIVYSLGFRMEDLVQASDCLPPTSTGYYCIISPASCAGSLGDHPQLRSAAQCLQCLSPRLRR